MDPIADTTAVTGLVDLARNVQTQIDLVKQFSSAECDLRPFKQDIRAFRHTLDELQAVLEGATPNLKQARRPPTPQALRELFLLRASIRSGKSTFLRLDTVLKQLAGDNIVLQYPPGRPPRRLLKVMNVLRRIRDETERLNIWYVLEEVLWIMGSRGILTKVQLPLQLPRPPSHLIPQPRPPDNAPCRLDEDRNDRAR